MSNIYAVRNDGYTFQQLDLNTYDFVSHRPASVDEDTVLDFSKLNYAMSDWWKTPVAKFSHINDESDPIPDVSKWVDACLVLSPKAYRLLGDLLKAWGEFLPVKVQNDTYYIFNCLTFGEVKEDECEKSYYEGEEFGIKTIVFDEADTENKLTFKTKYNSCFELYCGNRFKEAVKSFGLTGLSFSEKLVEDFN